MIPVKHKFKTLFTETIWQKPIKSNSTERSYAERRTSHFTLKKASPALI